ncbi:MULTISPECIES: monovalent cation/H+ antiporter complex subunit F [unclassified Brevibacterium]|uniref:monovalent cation/H+ antiporter complex subunit F n=1 Tax=unclassified Brevibacterium TaxID=2614124 RepID=UPI00109280A2|nr:monovalent cation/H+ antiporter complex subunit F [Brevibacterium sp. S22]TGD31651.1 sodium:proton antiporter [Brevibacterium sp. S22]
MSEIVLHTLVIAGAVLLAASVVAALYRIVRGPSILDRMIGTDVVLASIMCGLGGYMALSDRTDLLPVLIVLAMLGFVGSVSVSRYVSKSDSMTPGAEAGALSDFSNTDWHMPRDADAEDSAEESVEGSAEAADRAQPRAEPTSVRAARPSDEVTEIADPTYDVHADSGGEGEGTGPDPGPDDAEHMSTEKGEGNSRGS